MFYTTHHSTSSSINSAFTITCLRDCSSKLCNSKHRTTIKYTEKSSVRSVWSDISYGKVKLISRGETNEVRRMREVDETRSPGHEIKAEDERTTSFAFVRGGKRKRRLVRLLRTSFRFLPSSHRGRYHLAMSQRSRFPDTCCQNRVAGSIRH